MISIVKSERKRLSRFYSNEIDNKTGNSCFLFKKKTAQSFQIIAIKFYYLFQVWLISTRCWFHGKQILSSHHLTHGGILSTSVFDRRQWNFFNNFYTSGPDSMKYVRIHSRESSSSSHLAKQPLSVKACQYHCWVRLSAAIGYPEQDFKF